MRRVIQPVRVLLRVSAYGFTYHGVDLIVFTRCNGNIALGRKDFYFRTAGQRLGKGLSKVIVLAEHVVPVVVYADFIADAAPVPVCGPCDPRTKQDYEDQQQIAACTQPGGWFAVLA